MTESSLWREHGEAWGSLDVGVDSAADLRRRVDRQTRRLRLIGWSEWGIAVLVVAWFVRLLPSVPAGERVGWVVATVLHVVVVSGFALWNRRGVWRPLGASTRDYLSLARERVHRGIRAANFVAGLIAVESVALLLWFGTAQRSGPIGTVGVSGVLAVVATTAIAGWYVRRQRHELVRLDDLERRLGDRPS